MKYSIKINKFMPVNQQFKKKYQQKLPNTENWKKIQSVRISLKIPERNCLMKRYFLLE